MADDKRGRESQARDADRRQRERALEAALERGDEPEPPVDDRTREDVETVVAAAEFPATGAAVVETAGDHEVDADDGTRAVADLVPDTETYTFESPEAVGQWVQRPTVATAMKRVIEASETLRDADFGRSRREAYLKTFHALVAVTPDDDDEGVGVVADWIVEHIHEKGKLPGSRAVRKRAATYCRDSGYEVRDDEWLGA